MPGKRLISPPLNSCKRFLFEKQGIKPLKKTPGGAPSTSEEVLEELALDYPLPKVILEYRGLAKLKSTYTDKLPLMINPKTGARAYLLSSGGYCHWPFVVYRSKPAKYSSA
ncbi:DNA polymerase I [Klebsiella variicola]|uniref:DNA-directed DNA polymerase n=1 Tax=Klebsiella variicola TaxID=244366 RepID=A0A7H4MAE8_KLEVA|nr:DNA polymerase I [Klebsiella variicola]